MSATDPLDRILGPLERPLRAGVEELHALERRAVAVQAQLDHAAARIDHAVTAAIRPSVRGVESELDAADAALIGAIRRSRVGTRGLGDDVVEAVTGVQARLDRMLRAVRYAAHIETRDADARLVVASTVGWGGDSVSAFDPALTADDLARHGQRLAVTLRHRQSRVRFVGVVLGGLTRIAAASSTGGLGALPALYRFVEQVLDAFDDLPAAPATAPGAAP